MRLQISYHKIFGMLHVKQKEDYDETKRFTATLFLLFDNVLLRLYDST